MRAWTMAAGLLLFLSSACMPPEWGANALLHPARRKPLIDADLPHEDFWLQSDGLALKGWLFHAQGSRRGLIVYLHGVGDNRSSGLGVARRFTPKGYDVLAYDSRAHGESEGSDCTYGFYEKVDLSRALDAVETLGVRADDAVLFGSSLGAAVALQAAADDPRIRGVVAQSPFSDLETVARERVAWVASRAAIAKAFSIAEQQGRFRAADVSPVAAAARIRVPVLLVHGKNDRETRPAHSQRIYEALAGPRRLVLVPGTGHNDVLGGEETWRTIGDWIAGLPQGAPDRRLSASSRSSIRP
jgi:uncharacterized protein